MPTTLHPRWLGVFHHGTPITFTFTFTDTLGAPADPSGCTITIHPPTADDIAKSITDMTRVEEGTWTLAYTPAVYDPGLWHVRVAATAGVIAADEMTFTIRHSIVLDAASAS